MSFSSYWTDLWNFLTEFDFHIWYIFSFPFYRYFAPVFLVVGGFFVVQCISKVKNLVL